METIQRGLEELEQSLDRDKVLVCVSLWAIDHLQHHLQQDPFELHFLSGSGGSPVPFAFLAGLHGCGLDEQSEPFKTLARLAQKRDGCFAYSSPSCKPAPSTDTDRVSPQVRAPVPARALPPGPRRTVGNPAPTKDYSLTDPLQGGSVVTRTTTAPDGSGHSSRPASSTGRPRDKIYICGYTKYPKEWLEALRS